MNKPRLDPTTDKRLAPQDRAVYARIYPLIQDIENELGMDITRLIAVNLVRRAVTRGADIEDLLEELRLHATHQVEYNAQLKKPQH
jgi:hypothetical protein